MNNDNSASSENVSTIVDLLDAKGISWGEYQEDQPYLGLRGLGLRQPADQEVRRYLRKHNPLVIYNSVARDEDRLAKLKNLTMFYEDLAANRLPRWMFITPNMTSDAHDSSVTVAGAAGRAASSWSRCSRTRRS